MTTPLPAPPAPSQDVDQLRLLSIFHYVVAAFCGLFATFPLIHVAMGIGIVTHRFPPTAPTSHPNDFPAFFGWIFIAMGALFVVFGWAFTIALVLSARRLERRTNYTYCFVVACLSCMFFPFGTLLGVFTIVVLSRPAVKALFEARLVA